MDHVIHDTYHCFLGEGFTCRELFSPCRTSYDLWWILILLKSHIYCLYVECVLRSIELSGRMLRWKRRLPCLNISPSGRSFHYITALSQNNADLLKKHGKYIKYLVQPKCFCSVFAARLVTARRHTGCTPGRRLVQGLQRLARRRLLGGGGDRTADHMISEKNPLYHLSHSRHTCLLTTLCTGAISSLSIHTVVWRQSCSVTVSTTGRFNRNKYSTVNSSLITSDSFFIYTAL